MWCTSGSAACGCAGLGNGADVGWRAICGSNLSWMSSGRRDCPRHDRARAGWGTRWLNVLKTLVTYRLIDPGSEWRLHRQWYEQSPMGDLLGEDFDLVQKDNLYRCLDKLLGHQHLVRAYRRVGEEVVEPNGLIAVLGQSVDTKRPFALDGIQQHSPQILPPFIPELPKRCLVHAMPSCSITDEASSSKNRVICKSFRTCTTTVASNPGAFSHGVDHEGGVRSRGCRASARGAWVRYEAIYLGALEANWPGTKENMPCLTHKRRFTTRLMRIWSEILKLRAPMDLTLPM